MLEFELTINEDGSIQVGRGTKEYNDIMRDIFKEMGTDPEGLNRFLSITDDIEMIFGDEVLCG